MKLAVFMREKSDFLSFWWLTLVILMVKICLI